MNIEIQKNNFLGRGWSFPPSFNPASQQVEMTENELDVRKSLEVLLQTTVGERIMQPKYGCNLEEYLFESMDTATKTIIKDKVETAILYFEPRIEVKKIVLDDSRQLEGIVLIEIEYIIRATNSRFNFVFPFYSNEGTELNVVTTNHRLAL
jgi:phage baseplate assembly protein W